ncbi:hypothetical protein PVK06_043253 [Gossypium arboreum]|uniref:SWIM-type domain-containing protein n=1 Tax=Gossypium arboreum TaxID=29729 RepID=A0ABR0MQI7_GOSAR|nr:hypothetical protein PVK06_043253 [Gossypium arboreum]
MLSVDPDVAHASEFSEYNDIILVHRLAVDPKSEELFIGQQFMTKDDCIFTIKQLNMKVSIDYEAVDSKSTIYVGYCIRQEPKHVTDSICHRGVGEHGIMTIFSNQLAEVDNLDVNNEAEISKSNIYGIRLMEFIGCRSGIPSRSYRIDLQNRQCDCRRFQTFWYPCAHVITACVDASIYVKQYIDKVYTLKCTLRIWGNEFPTLQDVSTWEVSLLTF